MISGRERKIIIPGELFFIALAIWLINLRYPNDYGFWHLAVNPYFFTAALISAYYGRGYGYTSLGISLVFMLIPLRVSGSIPVYWKHVLSKHYIYLAFVITAIYLFGTIQKSFTAVINSQRRFIRKTARDKIKLQKELKGIEAVNREFEERVLLQNDSITSLYSQIGALHSQNLTKSLNIFLSTVQKFIQSEKASIWEYQKDSNSLVMIANIGWGTDDILYTVENVDSSVSGWVFRNNKMFSVRMLLGYEVFSKMNTERNILTYPINISNATWGVLNIESMPFTKYNLYTEKILSILVDLAGPAIERAVEYELMIKHADVNSYTGLPSPSQFMTVIEKEMDKAVQKQGVFSIVIMEITGFDRMLSNYGESKAYGLLMKFFEEIMKLSDNQIDIFHYKEQNQFAVFYPNIDYDGAAFFCFQSLGMISSTPWSIDDNDVHFEVVFGYAATSKEKQNIDELLEGAEQLLEMQKV